MKRIIFVKVIFLFSVLGRVSIAAENSIYDFNWLDEDETVYVIQNKEYPTKNKFELNFHLTDSDHSAYQTSVALTGGLSYYFTEVYSIDLMYRSYINSNSNDLNSLLTDTGKKPLIRIVDSSAFMHFNWLPFYGKINTMNKIFYFYWGIGQGVGRFQTRTNYQTFKDTGVGLTYITEDVIGFNTKTFVKFFLSTNWNFGLEFDIYYFSAISDSDGTKSLTVFNDSSLIFGYLF